MSLVFVINGLRIMTAALSVLVARTRADYRALAIFLASTTAADIGQGLIKRVILDASTRPYEGLVRFAFHAHQAFFLTWHFGLAALAVRIFTRRSPRLVAVAYAAAIAILAAGYPTIRGDILARAYLAIELGCLALSVGCSVQWWSRREPMSLPVSMTVLILCIELSTLLGPYSGNLFADWDRAQAMYLVLYIAMAIVQGGFLWISRPISK